MTPPRTKAKTCGNCKHLQTDTAAGWDGRASLRYRCGLDGRSLAVVDFACGLWEESE